MLLCTSVGCPAWSSCLHSRSSLSLAQAVSGRLTRQMQLSCGYWESTAQSCLLSMQNYSTQVLNSTAARLMMSIHETPVVTAEESGHSLTMSATLRSRPLKERQSMHTAAVPASSNLQIGVKGKSLLFGSFTLAFGHSAFSLRATEPRNSHDFAHLLSGFGGTCDLRSRCCFGRSLPGTSGNPAMQEWRGRCRHRGRQNKLLMRSSNAQGVREAGIDLSRLYAIERCLVTSHGCLHSHISTCSNHQT